MIQLLKFQESGSRCCEILKLLRLYLQMLNDKMLKPNM